MKRHLHSWLSTLVLGVLVGCSSESSTGATIPATDSGGSAQGGGETTAIDGSAPRKSDGGDAGDSSSSSCKLVTNLRVMTAVDGVDLRFISPTKLVLGMRDIYEVDLCAPGTRSPLGRLPDGAWTFDAIDKGKIFTSTYQARRWGIWDGATFTPAASDCGAGDATQFVDVVGSTVLLNTDHNHYLFSHDVPACNQIELVPPEPADVTVMWRVDDRHARLSPDGTKVMMASYPSGSCSLDLKENDVTIYDVASKQYTAVSFSPPIANAECVGVGPFAWYPDNRRVLIAAGATLIEFDTKTGAAQEVTDPSVTSLPNPYAVEISPDGKTAVVSIGESIQVVRLTP